MDEGAEPIAEGSFEDDVIYETILEDLISMLTEIKPKYNGDSCLDKNFGRIQY